MIEKLKEYASQLGFEDLSLKLDRISSSLNDSKAPLVLPLVGEFSSGKTTLINALSDSKALESASEPTTATIYALHFGASMIRAIIHYQDGTITETENIAELHNKNLIDANLVEVYDTSLRVPSSIMFVDTPGLSSHDIKHRQNLVDFLPQADGVLLVVDVNQPITKSLTEFAKIIELSKRPLYMVLTQCDTKSGQDIEAQKKYIQDNTELHLSGFACVSAKTGALDDFFKLIEVIQADKTQILIRVNEFRCREVAKEMISRIDTLLKADESDDALDNEISEQQLKLKRLERELDNVAKNIESEIEKAGRDITRTFEDTIFDKLESIVTSSSNNYDAEAVSAINNTSSLLQNEFKTKVLGIFREYSNKCQGITSVELSDYKVGDFSYNLNLNEVGHEYDSQIGTALKVVVVIAGVVVAARAASGVIGAGAANSSATAGAAVANGGTLSTAEKITVAASTIDTASDVASMASNRRTVNRIGRIVNNGREYGEKISKELDTFNRYDQHVGHRIGCKKGLVEGLVGLVTERAMGRSQRKKIIHEYVDNTLAPAFKSEIERIVADITNSAKNTILSNSESDVNAITSALKHLSEERENHMEEYKQKINLFRTIRKDLIKL